MRIPLMEIFKNPTIRGMAETIGRLAKDQYNAIVPVEKREYYPLASAQKRLTVLCQRNPDGFSKILVVGIRDVFARIQAIEM